NPTHIRNGRIVVRDDARVAHRKASELETYRLAVGDVVLGRRGEMGRTAVVQKDSDKYLCGTGSMFVRAEHGWFPEFLCLVLRSPGVVAALEDDAVGSTMGNLNTTIVGNLTVPEVILSEQKEIVRRVDALFAFADSIESQVTAATTRCDKLTQSILAKA